MTLPKFIKRGENSTQKEQKTAGVNVPAVKHTDLLKTMHLQVQKAPQKSNPQPRRPIADGSVVHEDEEVNECSCGKNK